jgi:polyphosphate glucokinase
MTTLGIDIGGSGIKGGLVDVEKGEMLGERFRIPTPQPPLPNTVADVVGQVAAHFSYTGPVGVTFPGVVRPNGTIVTAVNLDPAWKGVDGPKLFSPHLQDAPVTVLNDADAAGLAEMRFGSGRGRGGVVILLTFGTGIGSAVFLNGKLLPNSELGHLQIRGKDAERRASDRVRQQKELHWKDWADRVGEVLEELEKLFSPDLFIVGGGVSRKAEKFLPHLQTKVEVVVEAAQMQNAAGIIGAACAAIPDDSASAS